MLVSRDKVFLFAFFSKPLLLRNECHSLCSISIIRFKLRLFENVYILFMFTICVEMGMAIIWIFISIIQPIQASTILYTNVLYKQPTAFEKLKP